MVLLMFFALFTLSFQAACAASFHIGNRTKYPTDDFKQMLLLLWMPYVIKNFDQFKR